MTNRDDTEASRRQQARTDEYRANLKIREQEMDEQDLERLEKLAHERGYVIGILEDRQPTSTVAIFDLAGSTDEGGIIDLGSMPLGEVEAFILESSVDPAEPLGEDAKTTATDPPSAWALSALRNHILSGGRQGPPVSP